MSFIEMKEIEKSFDGLPVLKKVSLSMDKGEVVAIIGPSGSGKSTFLRCLGQLEVIDRGTIVVDGTPLVRTEGDGNAVYTDKKTQQELLLRMGMVFQQFNLFPHMTVWDNILIAPQMVKGMKTAEIAPTAEALLKKSRPLGEKGCISFQALRRSETACSDCQSTGYESEHYAF